MTEDPTGSGARQTAPRVVIIGANRMRNELVAYFLAREAGQECQTFASLQELVIGTGQVTAILLDCTCIGPDAIREVCRRCGRQLTAKEHLVLFNLDPDAGLAREVMARGVRGIFHGDDSAAELGQGIAAILNGERRVPERAVGACLVSSPEQVGAALINPYPLTAREEEILAMISAGLTNEAIAERLYISSHTVKTHLYNIFRKIQVPNRMQAALWAAKNMARHRPAT